jgi:hypothetical protein
MSRYRKTMLESLLEVSDYLQEKHDCDKIHPDSTHEDWTKTEVDEELPVGHRSPSPGSDSTDSYAKMQDAKRKAKAAGDKEDNWQKYHEDMSLAPKGKGNKAAKALYKKEDLEVEIDEAPLDLAKIRAKRRAQGAKNLAKSNLHKLARHLDKQQAATDGHGGYAPDDGRPAHPSPKGIGGDGPPGRPRGGKYKIHTKRIAKRYKDMATAGKGKKSSSASDTEKVSASKALLAKLNAKKEGVEIGEAGLTSWPGPPVGGLDISKSKKKIQSDPSDAYDIKAKKGAVAAPGSGTIAKAKKAKASDVNKSLEQQMADARKESLDTWHPDPEKDRKSTSMKHHVKAVKQYDSREAAKKALEIVAKMRARKASQKEESEWAKSKRIDREVSAKLIKTHDEREKRYQAQQAKQKQHQKEEMQFKVKIKNLPAFYVPGKSAGQVKQSLRKNLRRPEDIESIDRVTSAAKKKDFRLRVAGKSE